MEHFKSFAVIDLETTGLDYDKDRIVQIALVEVTFKGKIVSSWSSYVNPERPMSSTHIHGLTDEDVKNSPTFKELLPTLKEKLADKILVAHNYEFDGMFLENQMKAVGDSFNASEYPHFCTKENAILFLANILSHTLKSCMKEYNIKFTGTHHDALNDATAAANILQKYLEYNKDNVFKNIKPYIDIKY
jgi:DNA polymerase III epsilon subunit family exonuclease